ncbi:MAG: signal peptide peptidase SppA [Kiritimatiellia bacterium]
MNKNVDQKRRSSGCGFGCLICFAVFFGMIAAFAALIFFGMSSGRLDTEFRSSLKGIRTAGYGEDEFPQMIEKWSTGTGTTKVVRINVNGMIMLSRSTWADRSAVTALRSIRRATADSQVKALIMEINSGGGGITASDIIYNALIDFKEAQPGRVIVTIMGDVAASGAYYISLPSDYILAHPTSVTGSIGVIMQSYNVRELAAKLGVRDVTVKSGENKDFFNPLTDVKPEQVAIMQRVISRMHDRFVTLVASNRKMDRSSVEKLADGRVYLADEAVRNGLIDGLGYYQDAENKVAELLNMPTVKVFRYQEQLTLNDIFGGGSPGIGMQLKHMISGEHSGSGLMYLWQPAGN